MTSRRQIYLTLANDKSKVLGIVSVILWIMGKLIKNSFSTRLLLHKTQTLSVLAIFSNLSRSIAKLCEDSLNCVGANLNFLSFIKSRYFSISNSCLHRAYVSSLLELFIVEYHDCLYVSRSRCFIRLKGISISF